MILVARGECEEIDEMSKRYNLGVLVKIPRIGMAEETLSGSFDSPSVPFGCAQGPSDSLRMTGSRLCADPRVIPLMNHAG